MTNRLAKEVSPYLQMHAENPVDWYPWNEEALKKAVEEKKPILLSIGYTACHWCHVMAHESFEDQETAETMNQLFINIKVDREERPDLDKIYQLSAQLLTRQVGGWPLTIFLMPGSQIPFFAGTYFPKERRGNFPSFQEVLNYVSMIFHKNQSELIQQNTSFENVLAELTAQSKISVDTLSVTPLEKAKNSLKNKYDFANGGFGGAPKFPMSSFLNFIYLYAVSGDKSCETIMNHTLNKMFQGGIYDQIGGGFFRYSVDEKWEIPHFEKMLYDNGLLLTIYSKMLAGQGPKIKGIANWLINEMQSPEGGFYSSLSADTEGKEGKFYVWSREEIQNHLSKEEYQVVSSYYGIDQSPNFQKSWHLQVRKQPDQIAKEKNISLDEVNKIIQVANEKLYQLRLKRVLPQVDEKIIVSWNGLAIKGMSLAGLMLKEPRYLQSAERCLEFIFTHLWKEGQLYSIYKDQSAKQLANLDDYVFLVEGLLQFLQASWSRKYFEFLLKLLTNINEFVDEEAGGFFFTSEHHEKLIYRIKQYSDEAIPSSSGIYTTLLSEIGYFLGENRYLHAAEKSLQNAFPHIEKYPDSYSSFLIALAYHYNPTQIVIVRGNPRDLEAWQDMFVAHYQPNRLGFFIPNDEDLPAPLNLKIVSNETVAYFCQGHRCLEPIKTLKEFENELRSNPFRIT